MQTDDNEPRGTTDSTPPTPGAAEREGTAFDPSPYMRQLRGRGGAGQDYLDVKWRLVWLRREHPDAQLSTELVKLDETSAVFKATVILPSGGSATGYGSETAADFGDFIEKAETKSIGRALNALGFGAQFAEEGDDSAPERLAATRAVAAPSPAPASRASQPVAPPGPAGPPPASATAAPRGEAPIELAVAAGRHRGGAAPPTPPAPPNAAIRSDQRSADADNAELDLADYSWSAFWKWVRKLGYRDQKAIEELIGRPTADLTPAELRDLVQTARGES